MKLGYVLLSFILISSTGVSALEVDERAHQLGDVLGTLVGCGLCISPPWFSRLPLLFFHQCAGILSLIVNTVAKYVSLFLIPSFYDLVLSLPSSWNPERIFDVVSMLLSLLKGFFDGAWTVGRFSFYRLCLSPMGKIVNGVVAELSIEDYYAHKELATRRVPARNIEEEP